MKKSSILILVTSFLVVFLASSSLFIFYITHSIEQDAQNINLAGVLRGSIQRITKLELSHISSDGLIARTNQIMDDFRSGQIPFAHKDSAFTKSMENLNLHWINLQESIQAYRQAPSSIGEQRIINESEALWQEADHAVFTAQMISENKIAYYKVSLAFLAINILVLVLLMVLIKRYVRDKLEFAAHHDFLTRLYNRNFFYEILSNEMEKSKRYDRNLSLILFDIDYFKIVNDVYGHHTGDEVLKQLAEICMQNSRRSDVVARVGGEEFAVIVPEASTANALQFAEKLRKSVQNHSFQEVGSISISLGVTQLSASDDMNSLYQRADDALYQAKNQGRNKAVMQAPEEEQVI